MSIIEIGRLMLGEAQSRLSVSAQNVANINTPGFKRVARFGDVVRDLAGQNVPKVSEYVDLRGGALTQSGRALDLAIEGDGFFLVRGPEGVFLTRSGRFQRGHDGLLVDSRGFAVQTVDGVGIVLDDQSPTITQSGVVLRDGVPVGRLAVVTPADPGALKSVGGGLFAAGQGLSDADGRIHQGALEASNVDLAAEMTAVMSAMRAAETGARIVQTYDGLMDQAISTFRQDGQ